MEDGRKLYSQFNKVLNEEGNREVAVLYGDGGRPYVVSREEEEGAIVVSGGREENIVFPNGSQIVVHKS